MFRPALGHRRGPLTRARARGNELQVRADDPRTVVPFNYDFDAGEEVLLRELSSYHRSDLVGGRIAIASAGRRW